MNELVEEALMLLLCQMAGEKSKRDDQRRMNDALPNSGSDF